MKSRSLFVVLSLLLLLGMTSGCAADANPQESPTYYEYFDTVSIIYSYAGDSKEIFDENCRVAVAELEAYHKMLDIYYEYSGINNLCTVNKNAGISPVEVDVRLLDFLEYAIDICKKCDMEINIAMGSVLSLWRDARAAASEGAATIPDVNALAQAEKHTDISNIIIDRENGTVYISDPECSIDVGAIGKGYAVMKVAELLQGRDAEGYVIDVGGNIRAIGTKPDGSGWITGITNPKGESHYYAAKILISDTSCVTSGDYERYFTVNGVNYHHIIDKDTLMPAEYFSSVSVVCSDSGLADALTTALFCMSHADGERLIADLEGVEAMWIYPNGQIEMTDGFRKLTVK